MLLAAGSTFTSMRVVSSSSARKQQLFKKKNFISGTITAYMLNKITSYNFQKPQLMTQHACGHMAAQSEFHVKFKSLAQMNSGSK